MTEFRAYNGANNTFVVKEVTRTAKVVEVWVGGRVPIVAMTMTNDQAILLGRALCPYKEYTRKERIAGAFYFSFAAVGAFAVISDIVHLLL